MVMDGWSTSRYMHYTLTHWVGGRWAPELAWSCLRTIYFRSPGRSRSLYWQQRQITFCAGFGEILIFLPATSFSLVLNRTSYAGLSPNREPAFILSYASKVSRVPNHYARDSQPAVLRCFIRPAYILNVVLYAPFMKKIVPLILLSFQWIIKLTNWFKKIIE
jgi:hypothetical protein